jgi:uncharacterized protein (DUF4415 family)
MTDKWPSFVTRDLGDSDEDAAEMMRRWEKYDREMKAIIAAGGVHQDEDGWWIDDRTGELIGPDPEIERPLSDLDLSKAKPFKEALPDLYESIKRSRGRPPVENPLQQISIRLEPEVIAKFKATGKGWQRRVNDILKRAKV